MPIPTPFHSRTSVLCESHEWRDWVGYLAPSTYESSHEREYFAIRNSAGLIDVTPLFKYEVTGSDSARLVDRIITRDVSKCKIGQVLYTPWCDEQGKIIDDGTVSRLSENHFRITAADPNLRWFQDCGYGMNITVVDVSEKLGALALQGPNAREILKAVGFDADIDHLKFFHLMQTKIDDFPVTITRTGYTGDLGYELWVAPKDAEQLWDILMDRGKGYGIMPVGIVAMDIARIEAGLLLIEVDYISSRKALIEDQKSSPFEVGLGWTVKFGEGDFVGRKALWEEKMDSPKWKWIGLDVHWDALENLFTAVNLAPQIAGRASREGVPIYKNGIQIGRITSHTFSPILKKYIAMGTVETKYDVKLGTQIDIEFTVEYTRHRASATIVKIPFFNPERKRR